MPRPDPAAGAAVVLPAILWVLATAAILLAADRDVVAWGLAPPAMLTGAIAAAGVWLEPAPVLAGLVLVNAAAALARAGRLGAVARSRSFGPGRGAWSLPKAGLAATAAALVLKAVIGRARPAGDPELWLTFAPFSAGTAFQSAPSAHAALAGALVATAVRLWPRGTWVWLASGLLVGTMRILSGEHWPSDVVAGLGLGALIGLWSAGDPAKRRTAGEARPA
ncbi:MAG: phosphatase PAP2 family protein [Brevundimonas sp.]